MLHYHGVFVGSANLALPGGLTGDSPQGDSPHKFSLAHLFVQFHHVLLDYRVRQDVLKQVFVSPGTRMEGWWVVVFELPLHMGTRMVILTEDFQSMPRSRDT